MNDLVYAIWLSLSCTPGSETFSKLLGKFHDAKGIFEADDSDIISCIGSKSKDRTALNDKTLDKAQEIHDFCIKKGVGTVSYFDRDYPSCLKEIKNPPVLLYYRGKLPDFDNEFAVAIVGTRHLSQYGRKNTFTVANDLARAGALVVSGMAIGIDGVALAGALAAGKKTVAVIGSGIDVCYPIQHKRLAREIVKQGCVITEYAPGTRPERFNFPIRNRIISALSRATLVMEGKERSGSLITARHATEQGRVVYAFPGNVGNDGSEASNLLIRNGARLFTSADDIVRDFETKSLGRLNPFKLSEKSDVDMNETLRTLEVACVAANDNVFTHARSNKESKYPIGNEEKEETIVEKSNVDEKLLLSFDKSLIALYKKIPVDKDVSVEELVDDDHSLRDVMQGVLKLEISRFITMLPGDRIKRNI